MSATLAQIAQQAGVSQATVSRVINGKPGVSQDRRAAVMQALGSMGIPTDRVLRTGTKLTAIVAPDLANPIFPQFVTGLVSRLAQLDHLAITCTYTPAGTSEESFLNLLQTQPIDSAVFLSGRYDTRDASLAQYTPLIADRGIPAAFLNGAVRDMDGLYVATDDAAAITMALRHLKDLGHRRIGLSLGDRNHYPSIMKYTAAMRFFEEEGIEHGDELTTWTTYGVTSGRMSAATLLDNGATAIACASDQLALGAIRAASLMGLSVPRDVSITGYDDSPLIASMTPPLTTIRQPVERMCQATVDGLMAMLGNRSLAKQRDAMLFEPELVVRESTGPVNAAARNA